MLGSENVSPGALSRMRRSMSTVSKDESSVITDTFYAKSTEYITYEGADGTKVEKAVKNEVSTIYLNMAKKEFYEAWESHWSTTIDEFRTPEN